MRIAYVCHYDAFRFDGVVEKISTQVSEWIAQGHRAEIFCLSPPADGRQPQLAARIFAFSGYRRRAGATLKLERAARAYAPDCIYMRADLYLPPLAGLLRSCASALEVNSHVGELSLHDRPWLALTYARFSNAVTVRSVSGLVFVNNDLARDALFAQSGKPSVVIGNGAGVRRSGDDRAPSNVRPRVVLLAGAVLPWQGLDKFLWLAEQMPEADFDLVGPSMSELPARPTENVTVHGMLTPTQCESILSGCDVGIGTLALHRKNGSEYSPLKVRAYLVAGLPVVIGYDDTDFLDEDPWYILKLPNTESNVRDHLAQIRSFVQRSRGRRAPREELAARLGAPAKEAQRLEFLERLVAARGS